jgi:hypothetical protein
LKPVYFAVGAAGEITTLVGAKAGVTAEEVGKLSRKPGVFTLLPDAWIRHSPHAKAAEAAAPVALLPGDVSLRANVGALVEKNRAKIDEAFAKLDEINNMAEEMGTLMTRPAMKFVKILAGRVLKAATDFDDVHYALTWRDGRLESEGWIRTLERSELRKWLEARKGTKPNDLIGLLPDRAFYMVDSAGTASALDGDVAALLDEAFGEGGRWFLLLLSPSFALHEHLTGQAAGVVTVQGMMALGMRSIHEVKPGAKIAEAIAALDPAKLNANLGGMLEIRIEKGFAKSGETPMHRMTFSCPIPEAAMMVGQMTTCFAVEGGYLLVTQSARAENDLRALILAIRSPEKKLHPHSKAMERLMPDRHEGLSINLGSLKPLLGMAAMFMPEAAQFLNAVPDDIWLSTALAVRDGNVHVRGDWPLKEVLDFAAKAKAMADER